MANPRFDRNRPYGSISPNHHGALLEQDGAFFDGAGVFMFRAGEEPGKAPAAVKAGQAKKAGAKAPVSSAPALATTATGMAEAAKAGVDLAAWAKGEANYPFFQVRKAAAEKYPNIEGSSAQAIAQGLAINGVLKLDEVRR